MKTHELSRQIATQTGARQELDTEYIEALRDVAAALQRGPDIPCKDVRIVRAEEDIAVGLRTLATLSAYNKQQWLTLATDYGIPLELNPRDSARDVLGKVLRYLESNPDFTKSLGQKLHKKRATHGKVDTSELENALTKLLTRNE